MTRRYTRMLLRPRPGAIGTLIQPHERRRVRVFRSGLLRGRPSRAMCFILIFPFVPHGASYCGTFFVRSGRADGGLVVVGGHLGVLALHCRGYVRGSRIAATRFSGTGFTGLNSGCAPACVRSHPHQTGPHRITHRAADFDIRRPGTTHSQFGKGRS